MDGVSVIVCCYNSAARIGETLRHLAMQNTEALSWEIVVVDNASSDDTKAVVSSFAIDLFPVGHLKIVDQPLRGLSNARSKGIESARYDIVVFCDDDNWFSSLYVQRVYDIFKGDPTIGAIGGVGVAIAEVKPPEWFETYGHLFAIGPQGVTSGVVDSATGSLYGAGLAIRKCIFSLFKARNYKPFLTDRIGAKLTSGGDTELCYITRLMGFKLWYSDSLSFQHFLPATRLTDDYLKRLWRSMNESYMLLITYRYLLQGVPVGRMTWLKDVVYQLFFLVKSFASHIVRQTFQSRLEADASICKLSAVLGQAGRYTERTLEMSKLLKMEIESTGTAVNTQHLSFTSRNRE